MIAADAINGCFELLSGVFVALSIRRLLHDKLVRGVSIWPVAFFTLWSLWNLYYYPSLHQWWSFLGGLGVLASNALYCAMMLYFIRLEKKGLTPPPAHGKGQA